MRLLNHVPSKKSCQRPSQIALNDQVRCSHPTSCGWQFLHLIVRATTLGLGCGWQCCTSCSKLVRYTAPEKNNEIHCYEGGENCQSKQGLGLELFLARVHQSLFVFNIF